MTQLLRLVAALTHDADTQVRFVSDPHALMDEAGLSEPLQAALFSMDPEVIGAAITAELKQHEVTPPTIKWPGPHPEVRSFQPSKAGAGAPVDLAVRGEGFLRSASLTLVSKDGGRTVPAAVTSVGGGFREATLHARVDLSDVPAGNYVVTVNNGHGSRDLRGFFPFVVT